MFPNVVFQKSKTMYNVQRHNNCVNNNQFDVCMYVEYENHVRFEFNSVGEPEDGCAMKQK